MENLTLPLSYTSLQLGDKIQSILSLIQAYQKPLRHSFDSAYHQGYLQAP
jgi:hypothetical protein